MSLTVVLIRIDSVRSAGFSSVTAVSLCDCSENENETPQEKIRDTPFYISLQQQMGNSEVVLIIKKRSYSGIEWVYTDFSAKLGASGNQYFRGTYDVSLNELIGSFERLHHDRYCPNAYCSTSQSVRVKWRAPNVTISGLIYFYVDIYPNRNSRNFLSFKKPLNITSDDLQQIKLEKKIELLKNSLTQQVAGDLLKESIAKEAAVESISRRITTSIIQQIKNEKPDEDFEDLDADYKDDRDSEEEVKGSHQKDKKVNLPLIISTIVVVVMLVGIVIFDICFLSRYKDQKMVEDEGQHGGIHSKEKTIDDRDAIDEENDKHGQELHLEKYSTSWAYLICFLKGTQQFLALLVDLLGWIKRFVSFM